MARGERTENHPNRRVGKDRWGNRERIEDVQTRAKKQEMDERNPHENKPGWRF